MYAKIINGVVNQYPYPLQQLYEDNPGVYFPADLTDEILSAHNAARIVVMGQPDHDPITHRVNEVTPTYSEARQRWEQSWQVIDRTAEEINSLTYAESKLVRKQRNDLIAACDWTQLPDSPVDKAEWATYRQALRDITKQPGFPLAVDWPTQP